MLTDFFRHTAATVFILKCTLFSAFSQAEATSVHLSVITSANPQSNALQSFIITPENALLKEGIKHASKQQTIGQQTPFVIEYTQKAEKNQQLQWQIKVADKQHGTINVLSEFKGKGRMLNSGFKWQSSKLDGSVKNRQRLVFRPRSFKHQPSIYKKGKGPGGQRRKYGGGTRNINELKYNPEFGYIVTLSILDKDKIISNHKTHLKMDYKDMIRQEYINHYDIKRYGRGKNGHIPIPKRDEISDIPEKPRSLKGNPLTESKYGLIINDGLLGLADKINSAYQNKLRHYKETGALKDLQKNKLKIPNNKLWLTSGWRNPERNEWYSNAVNGIHQRGGAIDLVIMAPSNSLEAAIGYWILWQALQQKKSEINAFWQLETNGRPMTTREFKQDIEPANGIPDAFDKADHLHANVLY
ncbi:hypothetical protein MNBD_GAMMA09-128 [hydrothermal vent metagenome]|uniref:Uncharacterized protein n=1 Tax=hydrothermal vent metagenome TaxID=652676 RepID=A0A3B0YQB6_9ZZZZ